MFLRNVSLKTSGKLYLYLVFDKQISKKISSASRSYIQQVFTSAKFHSKVLRSPPCKVKVTCRLCVSFKAQNFVFSSSSNFFFFHRLLDLPNNGPFMQGEEQAYQSGDKLNLNCTSARSYPASKLQFFINDNPVRL